MRWTLTMAALVACQDPPKTDDPTTTLTTTTTTSTTTTTTTTTSTTTETTPTSTGDCEVTSASPADGAVGVYARSPVVVTLADADPTATLSVIAAVGSSEVRGREVVWLGEPLVPETEYTVVLEAACGTVVTTFTTSDVGLPLTGDPVGTAFSFDIVNALWLEPQSVGALFGSQLADVALYGEVLALRGNRLEWLGALGDVADGQDLCSETVPLDAAWLSPYYEVALPELSFDLAGVTFPIESLVMSGTFSPAADRIQGAVSGLVDTRPLVDLLVPGGDDDAVCALFSSFGVTCEPCADNRPFCLSFDMHRVEAVPTNETIIERTAAAIANDQDC